MQIVEVSWSMAAKVWWSIFWRSVLVAMAVGFAIGAVLGIIGGILNLGQAFLVLSSLLSMIAGFAVAIWAVKKVLYKRFGDFSVVCVANSSIPQHPQQQATPAGE